MRNSDQFTLTQGILAQDVKFRLLLGDTVYWRSGKTILSAVNVTGDILGHVSICEIACAPGESTGKLSEDVSLKNMRVSMHNDYYIHIDQYPPEPESLTLEEALVHLGSGEVVYFITSTNKTKISLNVVEGDLFVRVDDGGWKRASNSMLMTLGSKTAFKE